ncbi:hypothetical protein [Oxynema aestuarii]|uniref:Roadblock/LAMTOR2 domain-containing protein n=1 Tax=Oxynema aestuarii AP17 TaxID=2064643 RepID=A0A6H1TT51_9CYAN|nr:hypothetical protein [Oxynema aestuarii]QIZ69615.1 hypothetical protein HCG48_02635 [Oxynema aestuarii AP17]
MVGNKNFPIDENLSSILRSFKDKFNGIKIVFLLSIDAEYSVISSYPKDESKNDEFIGDVCMSQVRNLLQENIILTEMELVTNDNKIYVIRVSDNFFLCLITDIDNFKIGLAKRFMEGTKNDILTAMKNYGGRA